MIFVTVGTHEQQFNRLIEYIDNLNIQEECFIQTGYSEYLPKRHSYSTMISYDEMHANISKSRIVITHGGPGSIMMALQAQKIPIVVPRQYKFGEHVNDHQVDFSVRMEKRNKIIAVYDINDLEEKIKNYSKLSKVITNDISLNTKLFNTKFKEIVNNLKLV